MHKIFRYFSQYGEDYLLWNFFDFKPTGFFIDIGAFDGIHLSNSYSFELAGWEGICVEPHPFYFNLCKENRPGSTCIRKACGQFEQLNALLHVDNTGLFSSLHEIGDEENIVGHFRLLKDIDIHVDSIEVDVVPLDSILQQHQLDRPIDFVSIDVEGVELEVLQGLDTARWRPRVLLVETNNEKNQAEINSYLEQHGYYFSRKTKANSFYVTCEEDSEKLRSIELNCLIEKQIHPLGADYTVPAYLHGLVLVRGLGMDVNKMRAKLEEFREITRMLKEKVDDQRDTIKKYDQWLTQCKERVSNGGVTDSLLPGDFRKAEHEHSNLLKEVEEKEAEIALLKSELARTPLKRFHDFWEKLVK